MKEWAWDGGRPSVDLLNTIRDRELKPRETLHTPLDLTAWLNQAGLLPATAKAEPAAAAQKAGLRIGEAAHAGPSAYEADETDLVTARALRAAIDQLTSPTGAARRLHAALGTPAPAEHPDGDSYDLPRPDAVAVINSLATGAVLAPRLGLDDTGHVVGVPPEASVAAALARLALDAIELLTSDELLRVCAADDCGIRFVDRSPARNRQWCSMRRCGNRTKARRHYNRARE